MKKYSLDTYTFKSHLTNAQVRERLAQRTLEKKHLLMEWTNKDFIGRIQTDKFEIFPASFLPYGAACVFEGTISPASEVKISSSLHKGFRILFVIWVILTAILFLLTCLINPVTVNSLMAFTVLMPTAAFIFRLFLHAMYVLARNKGLQKIRNILDIGNIQ